MNALARHGGALSVAAGGTFCAALTLDGHVIIWGTLPGGRRTVSPHFSSNVPAHTYRQQGRGLLADLHAQTGSSASRVLGNGGCKLHAFELLSAEGGVAWMLLLRQSLQSLRYALIGHPSCLES